MAAFRSAQMQAYEAIPAKMTYGLPHDEIVGAQMLIVALRGSKFIDCSIFPK